jgi:membrane-associated phospholipid phosphatase
MGLESLHKLEVDSIIIPIQNNRYWNSQALLCLPFHYSLQEVILAVIGVILLSCRINVELFGILSRNCGWLLFFTIVIKTCVKCKRPYDSYSRVKTLKYITQKDYSFPSGHSAIMSTITTTLVCYSKVYYVSSALIVTSYILTLLTGVSRVVLAVHYLSDIIIGWLIGMIVPMIFYFTSYHTYIITSTDEQLLCIITLLVCIIILTILTIIESNTSRWLLAWCVGTAILTSDTINRLLINNLLIVPHVIDDTNKILYTLRGVTGVIFLLLVYALWDNKYNLQYIFLMLALYWGYIINLYF